LEDAADLVRIPAHLFHAFVTPSPAGSVPDNHSISLQALSAWRLWPLRITTATVGFSNQTVPDQYRSNPRELLTSKKKWPPGRSARFTAFATIRRSALRGT